MAINLCDVAAVLRCNPDPDNTMFRSLVLRALLGITEASTGAGVVLEQQSFAFGAVPAAYGDTGLLDTTFRLRRLYVDNTTDADIAVSTDNGTTTAFTIPANTIGFNRDLGNFTANAQDDLQFKYVTAPSTGSVSFDGSY